MIDSSLFFSNLQLLKRTNPSLATQLISFTKKKIELEWILCQTHNVQNAYRKENGHAIFVHDPNGPLQEAQESFQQLITDVDVLYIYGIGFGYFYLAAVPWLKEQTNRLLIFLEDDFSLFTLFLHTRSATEFLLNSQVEVYSITDKISRKIRQIVEEQKSISFSYTALPYYEKYKNTTYFELKHQIAFESSQQESNDRELSTYGIHFFNQFYANLLKIPHSYQGNNLQQKFKNIPAIICGAGPSLIHQLSFLSSLQNRALLFAAGSALNILTYHSIWPHFGVAIDPTPESFHRQIMSRGFEIPIFYRTRLNHEALQAIHGPRIWMPESSFYALPRWIEKQLKLPSTNFLDGHSVVHQALQIAHFLGCQPIILTGMDLSMNSTHPYATGVEHHPLFPFQDYKMHLGSPIRVNNLAGEQVTSYWPWLAEAQWLDEYQRLYPELLIYNATESGIFLPSIPNRSLVEMQKEHLANTYDFDRLVFETLQQAGTTSVSFTEIFGSLKKFHFSLKRCQKHYQTILTLIKEADDFSIDNQILAIETKIKNETAYIYLLEQMSDFSLIRSQKEQRRISRLQDQPEKIFKQLQVWMKHYQFLLQNTHLHMELILRSERQYENSIYSLEQSKNIHENISDDHWPIFYASGAVYRQKIISCDSSFSTFLFYYENGTLKSSIQYKHDQLHGHTYLYYPTGLLRRELHFRLGKRHGLERSWYESGQLFTEIEYIENEAQRAFCWLPNGHLHRQIDNKQDFPHI